MAAVCISKMQETCCVLLQQVFSHCEVLCFTYFLDQLFYEVLCMKTVTLNSFDTLVIPFNWQKFAPVFSPHCRKITSDSVEKLYKC